MATGRFAAASISPSRAMSAGSGAAWAGSTRGASGTSAVSISMSSGRAMTTGPGRPCIATRKARDTISGTRSGVSISVAHLHMVPKTAR